MRGLCSLLRQSGRSSQDDPAKRRNRTSAAQDYSSLPMPLPPLELQREFARRVAAVEKLKTAHRASLAEMDALFAALQHRAFRGEL